ncbi:MAG: sigma-70 family RNA polymerase sigma factor [Propionibacteriales bacterium]|nr:sigma-70 family RNA polymerase sigma factor [Propionibacteriales bacterium]
MGNRSTEDSDLIAAAREGDREAFGQLFLRYRRAALGFARQLTGSDARAADLVSEAFIKILGQLDRGDGPKFGFLPYLTTTIRNLHIDGHRRDKRQFLVEDVADVVPADLARTPNPASQHAENATLMAAFAALPDGWREVLWRVEVLGQSHDETASAMGIKANAVGVMAFRAREGLREAYIAEHLVVNEDEACREAAIHIPRYVRGTLGARRAEKLTEHLRTCEHCRAAVADVREINTNLSGLLVPVLVGSVAFSSGPSGVAVHAAPTVGRAAAAAAGLSVALLVLIGSDTPEMRPSSEPSSSPTTVERPNVGGSKDPVAPTDTPTAPTSSAPTAGARPPSGAPVEPERVDPTPEDPLPLPTTPAVIPVTISAPYVTVAHSSVATLVRVEVRILDAGSAPVELVVKATNVVAAVVGPEWACAETHPGAGSLRLACSRRDAATETLAVTLQYADATQPVTGQIGFEDGSQVSSFVSGAGAVPAPSPSLSWISKTLKAMTP